MKPASRPAVASRFFRAVAACALVLVTACGAASSADRTGPPVPGEWRQVFGDEFTRQRLNSDRWVTCYDWNRRGCTNHGNDEKQWYLPGQVSVRDGTLRLDAERRATRGSDDRTHPWRSGMVSTGREHWDGRPRETFTYGYFEAAIRIPSEAGMFPAFWMMPASRYTPPEIDVMEFLDTTEEASMYVHWRGEDGGQHREKGIYGPADFPDEYHVFGLLWERDELVWYVDGIERFSVADPAKIPDVPMEVLINLAVGFPEPAPPPVDSARMWVDWVRVWQQ